MTIQKTLIWGVRKLNSTNIPSARLDAEILLEYELSKNSEWLIIHSADKINAKDFQKYQKLILRRTKHEPIAYITDKKEFFGLDFKVNKNVLIPRPETEILVEAVLTEVRKLGSYGVKKIADIGTGSGNISVAIATKFKNQKSKVKIYATDISKEALKVAKQNAKKHKVTSKVKFIQSDLFENFPPNSKFDIVCANLPYLDTGFKNLLQKSGESAGLKYEPKIAWQGGKTGAEIYERFFKQVKSHLEKNSKIFIEIGNEQAKLIRQIIKKQLPSAGWRTKIKIIKDLAGLNRVVVIS